MNGVCALFVAYLIIIFILKFLCIFLKFFQVGDTNLENVTHEEAVATLKATTERVVLAVSKQAANNMYRNHSRNPSPLPIVNIVPTQEVIRAKSVTPPPPTCEYIHICIFFFLLKTLI